MRPPFPYQLASVVTLMLLCESPCFSADGLKLPTGRTPFALSLSLSQIGTDSSRLQSWVKAGGVLRVSSDAAQLFGFTTVKPRERTFNRPGQRFGRAKSALPMGASPLLWSTSANSLATQTDGLPGIRQVFYELPTANDVLLSGIGQAGVPLLRVDESGSSLYVAAMRRYGKGWVVFTPAYIEERVDGAEFESNVQQFCIAAAQGDWQSLPASALADKPTWGERLDLLPNVGNKPEAGQQETPQPAAPKQAEPPAPKTSTVSEELALPLSTGEIEAISHVWQQAEQAPEEEGLQKRARAVTFLLQLRLGWLKPSGSTLNTTRQSSPAQNGQMQVQPIQNPGWREAFWEAQDGSDYAPFARWWNGVLALRNCELQPDRSPTPVLRPVSLTNDVIEAQDWWDGATPTLPDGTESPDDASAAIECAQDAENNSYQTSSLLASWTPRGGAPCSMFLSPAYVASNSLPPNPFDWGMPDTQRPTLIFVLAPVDPNRNRSHDLLGLPDPEWPDPAMPFGLVAHPIMWLPSNAVRSQMLWKLSGWWSGALPLRHGFDQLPMDFSISHTGGSTGSFEDWTGGAHNKVSTSFTPVKSSVKGEDQGTGMSITQTITPDSTQSHPLSWSLYSKGNIIQEANLQANCIRVPIYDDGAGPTLEALARIRNITSWADPRTDLYREYMERLWARQEQHTSFTPARVARITATLCLSQWLEGSNAPRWLSEGFQNVFSLDTGDYIEANESTPENLMLMPPEALPRVKVFNPRSALFADMELSARRESLVCDDVTRAPDHNSGKQPGNGRFLVGKDSTRCVLYLYDQFGVGAVMETLQRLGAGQSIDEALKATTGLTEAEFQAEALK